MAQNSLMWFRKGLRLHDNPALLEACKGADFVYPIFILDPFFLQNSSYRVGVNRYNFLLESLEDLHASLQKRGSRLLVLKGKPEEVLPKIFKEWNITKLCFEVDTEPYALNRDAMVKDIAAAAGVTVHTRWSHTLYDTDALIHKNSGKAPLTMASFTKLVDNMGPPPAPLPSPETIPAPNLGLKFTAPEETKVPSWQDVGYERAPTTPFKGGETLALERLTTSLANPSWVASFSKPETDPSAFESPATTVLSPYLKFGCLSARLFHLRLAEVLNSVKGKHTQPPVSLRGQLLWREFFYTVGYATPNFNKMAGNQICRQLPWQPNDEHLAAWTEGRTGFPWIDAIMNQLREWGWMHHLARHCVACFLTRGDLYISWEKGQEVFEEYLIDQDHFLNAANWMWLSASAFFNQYFRIYSPVTFGKKYDKNGNYIRRFVPALKDMPAAYIYEPWNAPLEVQQRAKCIIGKDYPRPIVDHATASKECMARMKAAYSGAARPEGDEPPGDGNDGEASGSAAAGPPPAKKPPAKRQKSILDYKSKEVTGQA